MANNNKATKKPAAKKPTAKKTATKSAKANAKRPERPFPRASLSEAVRVPLALKEYNGGNAWPPEDMKQVVESAIGNKTVTSNHFFYLTAAARDFGLTIGSRDAQEIALTDLGREFAYAGSSEDEKKALRKAFMAVDIFKRVFDHYKGEELPEKKYVANTLEGTFGLDPQVHDEFLELYRENLRFLGSAAKTDNPKGMKSNNHLTANIIDAGVTSGDDDLVVIAEPDEGSDRLCFVAIPFRTRTNQYPDGFFAEVLSQLIGPAGADAGFRVVTANQQGTDVIQSTIINALVDADLVVADLTEHNPNVLFELGVRMAVDKPVALMRAEGTDPIFDVDNMLRAFDYSPKLWKSTLVGDLPNLSAHIRASWERRNSDRTYMKILRGSIEAT